MSIWSVIFFIVTNFFNQMNPSSCLIALNRTKRLVNGQQFDFKKAPFQVTIHSDDQFLCSGVLITKNKIITTGDCVYDKDADSISFLLNIDGRPMGSTNDYLPVEKIIFHRDYKLNTGLNNLAGLIISKEVSKKLKSMRIRPIPVDQHKIIHSTETIITITGYGSDADDSEEPSSEMLQIEGHELPVVDCTNIFDDDFRADLTSCIEPIGSAEMLTGACHGDDGDPATFHNEKTNKLELMGIVVTKGECTPHQPIMIHRVDSMLHTKDH